MTDTELPVEVTKHNFRRKIWDYMMKNELVNFPNTLDKRIPNFKGAEEAAQRLAELEEFKKAKTIKISQDKYLEPVRFLALEANKEIIVPVPQLLHVTPVAGATKEQLKTFASRNGLLLCGKPLGVDSNIKVDLVVLGSVCVSREGYQLGKGEGFADLEFAIMMKMGAVTEDTVVVTTVHDCQIIDDLPPEIFKPHDVPVDIIVTPTQTIVVNPRLKKPIGIIWELLSQRKLRTVQILQQLKEMDEKEGKVVTLKEVDTDTETQRMNKKRSKHIRKRGTNLKKKTEGSKEGPEESDSNKLVTKSRPTRRRSNKVPKDGPENNESTTETQSKDENNEKTVPKRHRNSRQKLRANIDFSLKLSNISRGARIRDLKNTLQERGVKPCEITWQGYRGICYLHFSKLRNGSSSPDQPIQVDSIVASLQQMRIGESNDYNRDDYIVVKPAKPISRIEVTDVTTV